MTKRYKIPLFLLLSVFFCGFSQSGNSWHLKKFENGISVYTRNAQNSAFKELKSVCVLKTSLGSIVALLNDWDTYPQWVYKCGKSTTLKKISGAELIHYQTVVAPWPVDSRDFVVNVRLSQDPVSRIVKIVSSCRPDYIPKVPGYVRITEFSASWTLVPQKDGNVEVTYQLLVNPGGYVPAWLVNLAVVEGPYETTLHFMEWVMKEKYQKAIVPLIKD
ncbi:MAG: lipid-binding domain protein [Bacteroidetes bacterium]|nr:lipid-binding domain protein [Bacteroidota bacterium]